LVLSPSSLVDVAKLGEEAQWVSNRSSGQCKFWFFCAFRYALLLHKRTKICIAAELGRYA